MEKGLRDKEGRSVVGDAVAMEGCVPRTAEILGDTRFWGLRKTSVATRPTPLIEAAISE